MTGQRRTSIRLGSFALVLAGTFGTAYAIGERLPGHNHSCVTTTPDHGMGTGPESPTSPSVHLDEETVPCND